MAAPFPIAGPQIGQIVLYNNAGTIVPAIIYALSTAVPSLWAVSLGFFNASGVTNVASANYSAVSPLPASTWTFPSFL